MKMYHRQALVIDRIIPAMKATNHKQAYQLLCDVASQETGLDSKKLLKRLLAWERRNVSFGIGGGIAIPHLALEEIDRPCMVFARLSQVIDYNSVDGAPVDLIFLILSPESDGPYHLQRLARISRMLRDQGLCNRLRGTDNSDALQALLFDMSGRRLAA